MNKTRPCLKDFLKASRRCLKTEDKPSLDITLRMIDSAIDFMCQNDGDRIARKFLFLTASYHLFWLNQTSLDITLRMIDSAINFMCQNDRKFFLTAIFTAAVMGAFLDFLNANFDPLYF